MPSPFISNIFRFAIIAVAGASISQACLVKVQDKIDSVKPETWIGDRHPSLGSPSAPIKIVSFIDYQCPTCRSADPILRRMVSKRSDIALYYREFPLQMHQFAKSAAIVAENARAHGTFEAAHRRMMDGKDLTEAAIKDAARKAGVSTVESAQTKSKLESDRDLEKSVKLNYVPSFIVIKDGSSSLMSKQQLLDFLK